MVQFDLFDLFRTGSYSIPANNARTTPPATTLPNWPAALAPIACISRKFSKSSSATNRCTMRADIGKALIPAAPMQRVEFLARQHIHQLAKHHPAGRVQDKGQQAHPQDQDGLRAQEDICLPWWPNHQPQEEGGQPGKVILGGLASAFPPPAIRESGCRTSAPISGEALGAISETSTVTTIGKRMRTVRETGRDGIGHARPGAPFGGQQAHDRRLDDRHQRHVAVRRHRDAGSSSGASLEET